MLLILVTKEGLVSYPAVRWHHVSTNRMSAVCNNITADLCCAHQSSRLTPNAKRTATPRRAGNSRYADSFLSLIRLLSER